MIKMSIFLKCAKNSNLLIPLEYLPVDMKDAKWLKIYSVKLDK